MSQWPGTPMDQDAWPGTPVLTGPANQSARGGPHAGQREVLRQVGLTGRALLGGAAQAVEPLTEPIRYLMNQALPGNPVGNIEAATDQALTRMGVPEPQGGLEKGVQAVGRFATGAGLGAGGEMAAAKGAEKALGLIPKPKIEAFDSAQLRELANQSYKQAEDAGLVIKPQSFEYFVNRLANTVRKEGIDIDLTPDSAKALSRLQDAAKSGKPLALDEFEILRRKVLNAQASIKKPDKRIASIMKDQMDDYIDSVSQSDVLYGDSGKAATSLKNARSLWQRMRKSELIEETLERSIDDASMFSGSGFENALRKNFRNLGKNEKKMRGFSEQERNAIRAIGQGGPIGNSMRYLGKLAPTGIISGALGTGGGYAAMGPIGAAAIPIAGLIGRKGATEVTMGRVSKALDMVRRGEPRPSEIPEWLAPWLVGGTVGTDTND